MYSEISILSIRINVMCFFSNAKCQLDKDSSQRDEYSVSFYVIRLSCLHYKNDAVFRIDISSVLLSFVYFYHRLNTQNFCVFNKCFYLQSYSSAYLDVRFSLRKRMGEKRKEAERAVFC